MVGEEDTRVMSESLSKKTEVTLVEESEKLQNGQDVEINEISASHQSD